MIQRGEWGWEGGGKVENVNGLYQKLCLLFYKKYMFVLYLVF